MSDRTILLIIGALLVWFWSTVFMFVYHWMRT